MKKFKTEILFLTPLLFVYLFDGQLNGLNFLLFTLCFAGMGWGFHPEAVRGRGWRVLTGAGLLLGIGGIFNGNPWTASILVLTWFVMIGYGALSGQSFPVAAFNGMFSVLWSGWKQFLSQVSDTGRKAEKDEGDDGRGAGAYPYLIALLIGLFFFSLYAWSNPLLSMWVESIDWPSLTPATLFYLFSGLFIAIAAMRPLLLARLTIRDRRAPKTLLASNFDKEFAGKLLELKAGHLTLGLLNLMIIAYIVSDLYVFSRGELPESVSYSGYVHQGVESLILSILVAIALICYLFRGEINFLPESGVLRGLAYCWIGLNAGLALTTAYKNLLYIQEMGLTYKRIGVFIFLTLTLGGLVSTWLKVRRRWTFGRLVKENALLAYAVLVLFALPSWDVWIVRFNLRNPDYRDYGYLIGLSPEACFAMQTIDEDRDWGPVWDAKLKARLAQRKTSVESSRWVSWNYRDHLLTVHDF